MSQNSTSSATSTHFQPINTDNGVGGCNDTPTINSRLDKQVASVSRLQSNAVVLKEASVAVVNEVLDIINRIIFNGKSIAIAKLNSLKDTLGLVGNNVEADALVLSPLPSMQYVQRRRRVVSPVAQTLESFIENNSNGKRRRSNRSKVQASTEPKRLKTKHVDIQYPKPSNGTEYTPTEAYNLQKEYVHNKGPLMTWLCLTYT